MWLFDWLALIGIVLAIAIGVFAVVAEIWLLVIAFSRKDILLNRLLTIYLCQKARYGK